MASEYEYECQIEGQDRIAYRFMAHGLDRVTGEVGDGPSKEVLQKLFLREQNIVDVVSFQDVGKALWHPL